MELWVKCGQSGFINVMGVYRDVSLSFRMLAGGRRDLVRLCLTSIMFTFTLLLLFVYV